MGRSLFYGGWLLLQERATGQRPGSLFYNHSRHRKQSGLGEDTLSLHDGGAQAYQIPSIQTMHQGFNANVAALNILWLFFYSF